MKTNYLIFGIILTLSLFTLNNFALAEELENNQDNIENLEITESIESQEKIEQEEIAFEEELNLVSSEELKLLNEDHDDDDDDDDDSEVHVQSEENGDVEEGDEHDNDNDHDNEHLDVDEEDGEGHHEGSGAAHHHQESGHHSSQYTSEDPEFYMCFGMAIFLVTFAGICSGLTVGYLSIDDLGLEIKLQNGTEADKRAARAIIPILKNHHVLLCTLLISNAIAMEALPIFLDAVVPAYMAIIVSTVAVVVVGEIIPQAYCTGPSQLLIAEKMAPLVKGLICILRIFNVPIAYMLDKVLGLHEKKRYNPDEIQYLVSLYESMVPKCLNCSTKVQKVVDQNGLNFKCRKCEQEKNNVRTYFQCDNQCLNQIICNDCFDSSSFLYQTEVTIFQSIIEKINQHNKNASGENQEQQQQTLISEYSGFVPIDKLLMVSMNDKINRDSIHKISNKCYSNILVRDPKINDLVGVIKAKSLIPYINEDTNIQFKERMVSKLLFIEDNESILQVINKFKEKQTSLAIIIAPKGSEDKYKNLNNRQQDIQDLKQNRPINVEQYSSLVPTQELFKKKNKPSKELEHNGQKILGLLTIKDLFEYLINIDFGESNQQDEEFRRINHVEAEDYSKRNNTQSIRQILGQNTNSKRTVIKAVSKFKKPLSNNNLEQEPSQADIVRQNLSNAQRLDPGIPEQ